MSHGSAISKQDAKTLIQKFQADNPDEKKAFLYDASLIQDLLDDSTSTVGVRIYLGKNNEDDLCLVLVGTDTNGGDLTNELILEMGSPCPAECDPNSYFNS